MSDTPAYKRIQNRPAHIVIDSAAFQHNLLEVRERVSGVKVMAVIKADGYGHGMEVAASSLSDADEFAVNSLDDVHRLRKYGVTKPLTMLSASLTFEQLRSLRKLNTRTVFYDWEQMPLFKQLDQNSRQDVWLKVDTGMGRLGVSVDEMETAYKQLSMCEGVGAISLMSHLANADDPKHPMNAQQINHVTELASRVDFTEVSLLNSAGVISYADAAMSFVRPGIMLYGISPTTGASAAQLGLKPVMTFKSKLLSVKRLPAGSSIGYGSQYTLDSDSRVGVVACGYGDGYPRHAPSGTPVLVNGMLVPLIGRVSMDMLAVDLGELPAKVGDDVVLWGEDNPVEDVARAAGTIAYELTCGILPRVERVLI